MHFSISWVAEGHEWWRNALTSAKKKSKPELCIMWRRHFLIEPLIYWLEKVLKRVDLVKLKAIREEKSFLCRFHEFPYVYFDPMHWAGNIIACIIHYMHTWISCIQSKQIGKWKFCISLKYVNWLRLTHRKDVSYIQIHTFHASIWDL